MSGLIIASALAPGRATGFGSVGVVSSDFNEEGCRASPESNGGRRDYSESAKARALWQTLRMVKGCRLAARYAEASHHSAFDACVGYSCGST
eukprot:6180377-Pleurochrysis_carterae.AAC.2